MSDLVVRLYNVRFGDAVLVMIPETSGGHDVVRTILFDFGNALSEEGGVDAVFEPVIDDLRTTLGGRKLDLHIVTHEHLDHVQGFFYSKKEFGKTVKAKQVWLTGSADPDYYTTHPEAKKEKKAAFAAYRAARARLDALPEVSFFTAVLLANNNPRSTFDCVKFLREELADKEDVHFVSRMTDLSKLQPAKTARLTLWAPEENTAEYYGKFKPLAASLRFGDDVELFDDLDLGLEEPEELELPEPPRGVDAGAFYNLLDVRHSNSTSSLLNIDQAANNTSVVTLIEWQGWRLLFTGDAEKRSWRQMDKLGLVGPVHFLKVSHHASHTGMPPTAILDKLLPKPSSASKKRRAGVSTFPGNYPSVPNKDTLKDLRTRTKLVSTLDEPIELYKEIRFPDTGPPS